MSTPYRPLPVVATIPARRPIPELVEVEDLPSLGWVTIHHVGSENAYMTDAECAEHFVKL